MKKLFILLSVICACFLASAQKVQESVIDFGKQQTNGYLVNVPNASIELVDAAFKEKLEKQYALKSSKENGFRAYINQNMSAFGSANYDIYYKVGEFGKKKHKTTQLTLIVSSGNMNAITSSNNAEVAENIKKFLAEFVNYVDEYSVQQEINSLMDKLTKLNNEKAGLEKDDAKIDKQIEKLNKEKATIQKNLEQKNTDIKKLEDEINRLKKQK